MVDNLSERGAPDRARIDVHQPHELRYWSHKLGITEDQLREAVQQVGPMAEKVEGLLRNKAA